MSYPAGPTPLDRAVEVMDRLRSPGGCPWDAAQTHRSLARYLVEETYEVLEAIESDDPVLLREELGDLLLQVLFHARLAQEQPPGTAFGIDEVAADLVDKLIRRHPHVFAGAVTGDAATLNETWEQQKIAEKGRTSAVDGVPVAQPALALAAKLVSRATRAGLVGVLDTDPRGTGDADAVTGGDTPVTGGDTSVPGDAEAAIARRLLDVVRDAAAAGVDPEGALRRRARDLRAAIVAAEAADSS